MELSATAYVILGMLSRGPRSGYEIKSAVDNSTRFFWAASYGQIYPELRRLADANLIEGESAPRGGRKRTVYSLTPAGRAELKSWLRRPPELFETRDEGLLKLFFADAGEPQDAVEIVRAMRSHRLDVLESLRSIEPMAAAHADSFPYMVLQGGIGLNEWIADWCERVERELQSPKRQKRSA